MGKFRDPSSWELGKQLMTNPLKKKSQKIGMQILKDREVWKRTIEEAKVLIELWCLEEKEEGDCYFQRVLHPEASIWAQEG